MLTYYKLSEMQIFDEYKYYVEKATAEDMISGYILCYDRETLEDLAEKLNTMYD